MNLVSLILYGVLNVVMVLAHLFGKGRYYQFPFWAGIIALGWFMPQAVGGYLNVSEFPGDAYMDGMLFATFCTAALWIGFAQSLNKSPQNPSWLDASFDTQRLYVCGILLCAVGFFFQWKLSNLPDELTSMTQWSGAAVKYFFLSSVFIFGFITLWLIYLSKKKLFAPGLLLFILPSLYLLFDTAVLKGRRAAMMNLVSYLAVSLWLVRRIALPRWLIICGLSFGLILINAIGIYRSIMLDRETSLSERFATLRKADLSDSTKIVLEESGAEFKNYIFYRQIYVETGDFDFGAVHWNQVVFNYVPAQIVGRAFKDALTLPLCDPIALAREKYGHSFLTGTTTTGYMDAFASFGWFGFVKYLLIGSIMGSLYRHAMLGSFLPQLLYVYSLGTAMHSVSHGTNAILFSLWIYFFALGYPVLHFAKTPRPAE